MSSKLDGLFDHNEVCVYPDARLTRSGLRLSESERRSSLRSIVLSLFFLFTVAGCASMGTYNPATGKKEFIFISTSEEITLGHDVHKKLKQKYKESNQTEKIQRINRIGRRLAQVSDRQDYQYHFYLIEEDELNAFTTPGGNIYLFTGLVDRLESDEQIASVIAHEIGHCAARHTIKKFQAAMGYNFIGGLVLGQVAGEQAQEIVSMSSNMLMNVVFSAYGRKDEYEADRLGIKYLYLASFDPQVTVETLGILEQESKGGGAPLMLRSHPYLSDRIKAAQQEIELVDDQYETAR